VEAGLRRPLPATDEQLVRQLYDEHAGMLLGYVRRLVGGDTARAEDVVQETLLRAWQHPSALVADGAGGASARAWLLTVARHLVVDGERARRARPREVAVVDPAGNGTPDPAVRFDDRGFDRVLLAHGVAEALGTLTADHRAVIENLYFRDRSVSDTARDLGVPEGTVKSRAYYALRALRVACEERGIVP
jgi:RNA polymerase sigma-70 factor (ECF subfamily)